MLATQQETQLNVLQQLNADLTKRLALLRADRNKSTVFLRDIDAESLLMMSIPIILSTVGSGKTLADTVVAVGRRIMQKRRMPRDIWQSTAVGWFICVSFIECGLLKYVLKHKKDKNGKSNRHQSYFFVAKSYTLFDSLLSLVEISKIDQLPNREPYPDWTEMVHESGRTAIKRVTEAQAERVPDTPDWIAYKALNKLQHQGWAINRDVFAVFQRCLLEPEPESSPFKFHKEPDRQKKKSQEFEARSVSRVAASLQNEVFYHLFNYDWRGRIYCNTAYLNEQSSDNAKGLLRFADEVPLGSEGLKWLSVHASNCWGHDKDTIDGRVEFTLGHQSDMAGYAEDPMTNRGWMKADKPFMFLACCFEFKRLMVWVDEGGSVEDFRSYIPIYIDGSNNGVQHLAALSQDETVGPLVNLVPQDLPGDVYMYIADFVWEKLEKMEAAIPPEDVAKFDGLFEEVIRMQAEYEAAKPKSEEKQIAFAKAAEWRNANRDLRMKLFPVYWNRIKSRKDRRKIVKRNVMTLGYGGTPYGMGQQVIDDTRDMSDYLRNKEHLWGAMLGQIVYTTCYEKLPGPAAMLRLFQAIAVRSNERLEDLSWTVPGTDFPVTQCYRKPIERRVKLRYGEEELKIVVQDWDQAVLDKGGQETGAAPNIVHSFDAAHLNLVVNAVDYPISVVHDSFGCHAGNMGDLFHTVREEFMKLYAYDPLMCILEQNNCLDLLPKRGSLSVSDILKADYAFL